MDKEKMVQIYEVMADMTLEMINKEKNAFCLGANELEMVRTTQSLYETINYANRSVIAAASTTESRMSNVGNSCFNC